MYTKRISIIALLVAVLTFVFQSPVNAQTPTPSTPATQPQVPAEILRFFFGQQSPVPSAEPTPAQLEEFYRSVWSMIAEKYYNEDALMEWGKWEHAYDGKLTTEAELDAALVEMVNSLGDRWTQYTPVSASAASRRKAENSIVRIGIALKRSPDGSYVIEGLRAGSPASTSSLRNGDTIKAIDGKALAGLSPAEASTLLEGKLGTKVAITYLKDGKDETVTLTFSPNAPVHSEAALLPGGTLYLRLRQFDKAQHNAFEKAINQLARQPGFAFDDIVLDLRGNSGGSLGIAYHVVETFLSKGTIASYDERSGRLVQSVTQKVRGFLPFAAKSLAEASVCQTTLLHDKPMIVLVDNNSASASEIVTAALAENDRARIVGVTTWGKSAAYVEHELDNDADLSITVSGIKSPKGNDWSGKGLTPHFVVEQPRNNAVDVQLMRAIEILKDKKPSQ